MEELLKYINQPLSMGGATVVVVIVLTLRIRAIEKAIDEIKDQCKSRFKWCYPSAHKTDKKGGDN